MRTFIEHVIVEQELRMDRELNKSIKAHAKDYKAFMDGKQDLLDLPKLYDALLNHWQTDMPYGVLKARDGDPYEWSSNKLSQLSEHGEPMPKSLVHNWATHITHPSLGTEELEVVSHSLDEDGRIEQYRVSAPERSQINSTIVLEASEVTVTREQSHKHPPKKKIKVEMSMNKRRKMGVM